MRHDADVLVFNSLASTNEHAREIAPKLDKTTIIAALEQTGAKGTKGRSFYCGNGEGLYFSVALGPVPDLRRANLVTPAAGVAVATMLCDLCGVDARIKWVNDVVIDDKKICGILSESRFKDSVLEYLIVGIGINLNVKSFPEEIADKATSLDRHNPDFDPNEMCAKITDSLLDMIYDDRELKFMSEYKRLSSVLGRYVDFESGGTKLTGIASDINKNGNLVVVVGDRNYIINAGDVSITLIN